MTLPDSYNGSINTLHYYQGVLIAEVALTLIIYLLLKIIHYVKWGHDEESSSAPEHKPEEPKAVEEGDSESKVSATLCRNGTKRPGTCTSP
jgi:hypothetical protein